MRIESNLKIIAGPHIEQAVAKDFEVEEKDIKELINASGEMPSNEEQED